MLQPSFLTACVASLVFAASSLAEAPLHQRIDQGITAGKADFEKQAAPLASDGEFLRRVYLDLTGAIPPAAEARAFLADTDPDKRAKLVDRLLASPEHARHMALVFDVLLMERRPDKNVPRPAWQEYLRASFAENKPWDQLVREVLAADGLDPKLRPAAKFILDRDGEPNQVTRDIGRFFLGMNLTCCQCHDHPLVDAYKQDHYYGIYAFLNRSSLFKDPKLGMVMAEKADGDVTFQSVFDKQKLTKSSGPRVPGGELVKEPALEKGKEYDVAPAANVRPVPKFSRRAQLAPQVGNPENVHFRRNIANRLWAHMMGRGLVHPVDYDHEGNPPSHPELLGLLAGEIAATKFDMRAFLRELALTKTYQRSSELPDGVKESRPETFAVAQLKPLSPEQLGFSLLQATGLMDMQKLTEKNEAALYTKLSASVAPIVTLFAGTPGKPESYQATIDQALFINNGKLVRGWLVPTKGNLLDRLAPIQEAGALANELFLSVLTRMPTEEERKDITEYLKNRSDRPAALQELAWALLASAEFRFNH